MASVKVDSGPLTASQFLFSVPREKWAELVKVRRAYADKQFYLDCRYLVRFVQEAEQMWQPLGYKDINDLVQHGYGLDPEEVWLARDWLAIIDPTNPVTFPEAVAQGKRHRAAMESAAKTQEALGGHGGIRQPLDETPETATVGRVQQAAIDATKHQDSNSHKWNLGSCQTHGKNKTVRGGNNSSYRVAKLRRDHPIRQNAKTVGSNADPHG